MIHDVDESLRALVKRDALNGSKVEIAFDAPTKDWVARRNAPTIDMYLYDIREDVTRRDTSWVEVRDEKGIVTERRLPPRRFRLSYLVTAWTNRPEDEHRLLSALLSCFVRHEFMPSEVLTGTLEGQHLPVLINVALPVPADRSIADVWSAMGGELKPSLDVIVTAPLDVERSLAVGPPVKEEPFLAVARMEPEDKSAKGRRGAGGIVRRFERTRPTAESDIAAIASNGADAEGAAAEGKAGGTAGKGKGKGGAAGAGGAVVPVVPGGTGGAAGGSGARGSRGAPGGGEEPVLPDETFYASAPGKPGRRIRVRELPRPRPRR